MPGYQVYQSWYSGLLVNQNHTQGISQAVIFAVLAIIGLCTYIASFQEFIKRFCICGALPNTLSEISFKLFMEKFELREDVKIQIPQIDPTAFIADGAKVMVCEKQIVQFVQYVARADINQIIIGERSNIQDNSVMHLENDQGVTIGDDVTIGHKAIIHGCDIKDGALIGMGSIIMNGASIGKGAVIGAGAVVTENMQVPDLVWLLVYLGK